MCGECAAGHVLVTGRCVACPRGHYREDGMSACAPCLDAQAGADRNRYADSEGAATCKTCPAGSQVRL